MDDTHFPPVCPLLHRPRPEQPGSLLEQVGAILLYHSLPPFVTEAMPDGAWQHARERCIPHAKGGAR